MRVLTRILIAAALVAGGASAAFAAKEGGDCVKRHMAKGESACIAKAKCDGVTSRKEAARRCGG